jgi:hypothetical protein
MKKQMMRTVQFCDECGKESEYGPTCCGCGRVFCHDCSKKIHNYNAGVYHSGSGDVSWCPSCHCKAYSKKDPLLMAYRKVAKLRDEADRMHKRFEARKQVAESNAEKLFNARFK